MALLKRLISGGRGANKSFTKVKQQNNAFCLFTKHMSLISTVSILIILKIAEMQALSQQPTKVYKIFPHHMISDIDAGLNFSLIYHTAFSIKFQTLFRKRKTTTTSDVGFPFFFPRLYFSFYKGDSLRIEVNENVIEFIWCFDLA